MFVRSKEWSEATYTWIDRLPRCVPRRTAVHKARNLCFPHRKAAQTFWWLEVEKRRNYIRLNALFWSKTSDTPTKHTTTDCDADKRKHKKCKYGNGKFPRRTVIFTPLYFNKRLHLPIFLCPFLPFFSMCRTVLRKHAKSVYCTFEVGAPSSLVGMWRLKVQTHFCRKGNSHLIWSVRKRETHFFKNDFAFVWAPIYGSLAEKTKWKKFQHSAKNKVVQRDQVVHALNQWPDFKSPYLKTGYTTLGVS